MLQAVGLQEVRDQKGTNLLQGHEGRLSLAQALLGSPPIIFMDEPTSGQDPLARVAIRDLCSATVRWVGPSSSTPISSPTWSACCSIVYVRTRTAMALE